MKYLVVAFIVCCRLCAVAQVITTIAGGGTLTSFGVPATNAAIYNPHFLNFDQTNNLYFSEFSGNRIKRINTSGVLSLVAGTGTMGYSGDGGAATNAKLKFPEGIAVDSLGNLYIADHQNYRIRKVDISTGIISTIAGTGIFGDVGDGSAAIFAQFLPGDIAFDRRGNLYISDNYYHKIRKIGTDGIINTLAGTGFAGFGGDGGAATSALLNYPTSLAVDTKDNLYIVDALNKRVRKIDTFGYITTVAGIGVGTYTGDGIPATTAGVGPLCIALDKAGNLYITDSSQRVRKVDTFGIIHTIAGTGTTGFSGDGFAATMAQVNNLGGIVIDACNNVYFVDVGNNRIRKVTYPPILTVPTISLSGETNMPVSSTVTVTATVANAGSSYLIHWMNHGIEFTTTTAPSVTYTKPPGVDTITARIVPTSYGCWDSTTSAGHMVMVGTTGIPSAQATSGIAIYPNPAGGSASIALSLNNEAQISISVIDMQGKEVLPATEQTLKAGKHTVELNTATLANGVYFLKITDGESATHTKLSIMH